MTEQLRQMLKYDDSLNTLNAKVDGLFVDTVDPYVKSIDETAMVDLAVDSADKLTAAAKVSAPDNNALSPEADGLYVAADFIQLLMIQLQLI